MTKERGHINPKKEPQDKIAPLRNALVDELIKNGFIQSKNIENAFRRIPRHLFLPEIDPDEVYQDVSIITKKKGVEPISSSTQPSLMASMLEILHLEEGMKVLEIGTGSGYNAALLAELVGGEKNVFSVDIDEEIIEKARQSLIRAGYQGITVKCARGADGLPETSPYDRIIVTCSVDNIPISLVKQLKEGGIIVLPIWFNGTQITPALEKQRDGNLVSLAVTIGGFMKMRSGISKEMQDRTGRRGAENLLICSEYPEIFSEEELESLLQSAHKNKKLPVKNILPPRGRNFFPFLALHERKSVEIFSEGDPNQFDFGESAAGIIDLEKDSACLMSEDNRLLVYHHSGTYQRLVSLARKWERMNYPEVDRLKIFACLGNKITPKKNDLLFREKQPVLIVRILTTKETT